MLSELHIENLAVISGVDLTLAPGLNVITGETGAGKTILAHAIALLLGSRAETGLIRPGAGEASVEAVFTLPPGYFADLADSIDIPNDEQLIVRRRLARDGRSRAFIGGRSVSLTVLEQLTSRCLKFSAQHDQRRLMMASHQLDILDSFGGKELIDLREEYTLLYDRRAQLLARREELSRDSQALAREAELLKFQIEEIEASGLVPGEDDELALERERLLRARELKEAALTVSGILGASGEEGGFMDALAEARVRLESVAGVDRELDKISQQLQNSFYELEETGRAARDYAEAVDLDAGRLTEIEERLELISQLKRKYGPTIEEVLKFADSARQRLALLTSAEADRSGLEDDLKKTTSTAIELALKLRHLRQKAAKELEAQAGVHLQDLAFHDCGFEVRLFPLEGEKKPPAASLTRSGLDAVEFYVSLNPGMPAAPLKETASGGELSRIMLAIKSTVAVDEAVTLVFDEIDAGIGGETGSAVGAKLKKLADHSQIICITHLPQIACYADAHFSVIKSSKGGKTVTRVTRLSKEDVVGELCRMMGSHPGNEKAREHAVSLLEKVSK